MRFIFNTFIFRAEGFIRRVNRSRKHMWSVYGFSFQFKEGLKSACHLTCVVIFSPPFTLTMLSFVSMCPTWIYLIIVLIFYHKICCGATHYEAVFTAFNYYYSIYRVIVFLLTIIKWPLKRKKENDKSIFKYSFYVLSEKFFFFWKRDFLKS